MVMENELYDADHKQFFFGNKIAITQEQRLQPFKEGKKKKQRVDHHHYKP
jgi:hypothetical protein